MTRLAADGAPVGAIGTGSAGMVEGSMSVSTFDIFKVVIEPNGSHIVDRKIAACYIDLWTVDDHPIPYRFRSCEELLQMCKASGHTIADLMLENEKCWRSTYDIRARLLAIASVMDASIVRGRTIGGDLPGPICVRHAGGERNQQLAKPGEGALRPPFSLLYTFNHEEDAAGSLTVAHENDVADVIPTVLHYYRKCVPGASDEGVVDFLLTAAAIGILHREEAEISGAEACRQDEVGVACSMAAAGLTAVLGGSNEQIENAVAIGLRQDPRMSYEPAEGLVQIPGIVSVPKATIAAIRAARTALGGIILHHLARATPMYGATISAF